MEYPVPLLVLLALANVGALLYTRVIELQIIAAREDAKQAKTDAKAAQDDAAGAERALAAHKLHAAENFARRSDVKEGFEKLEKELGEIKDRLPPKQKP